MLKDKSTIISVILSSCLSFSAVAHYPDPENPSLFLPSVNFTGKKISDLKALGIKQIKLDSIVSGIQKDTHKPLCEVTWAGELPFNNKENSHVIDLIKEYGPQAVVISLGGSKGTPLAISCETEGLLIAQYRKIQEMLGVHQLDFVFSEAWLQDSAAVERHNKVVATMQKNDPSLKVWYSFPLTINGLSYTAKEALSTMLQADLKIAWLNLIADNFPIKEGDTLISESITRAIDMAVNDIHKIFADLGSGEITKDDIYHGIGITPMIGRKHKDQPVFNLQSATHLMAYMQEKHLEGISIPLNRDQPCKEEEFTLNEECSGDKNHPVYGFTDIFKGYTHPAHDHD
ncbi:hypothetical protein ACH42_13060 [Endozoicomonas sp. (ex Bugula neritina AB1)]|nr:hypothetical protein ACH42_13060 [Endozoicomonas sp. (ex Bugula neritina AB1)]